MRGEVLRGSRYCRLKSGLLGERLWNLHDFIIARPGLGAYPNEHGILTRLPSQTALSLPSAKVVRLAIDPPDGVAFTVATGSGLYLAKALVVFPGGFVAMDEMMEILTPVQTRKLAKKMTIVIYGSAYWNEAINFQALVKHGMIAPEDLELFRFADDPQTAFELLRPVLAAYAAQADTLEMPAFAKSRNPQQPGGERGSLEAVSPRRS